MEKVSPAAKNMREAMPITAAWIDALRFEFGQADVDGWIRQGMKDGSFRAEEAGHRIGGKATQREDGDG